ncbi:MAG: hypothetical protein JW757_04155 [Anaerolineales bacterium]|nr:hypothetical protein [Anaerolineales bacterium]
MLSPNVKLVPPRRQPRTLHRTRLLDMLHNNIHRKVLFVCAPAGYGKTTLLVDFADDIDAVVYWFRITTDDTNLATFYENVIQSFKLHHPEFGNDLALSLEEGLPSPQELAYRLVNQLEETLQDFSILVLDDYHLVSVEPEITDFVEALINYLPDQLRIMIGSRNVYGIPTALLYVQEQLAIISEDDLKFRQDEIIELCWRYYHIQLTAEQSTQILEQAEGWIVAILLALRSENLSVEIPKILGARQHVYTYLADEVIHSLPEHLINFLYATSLVDEFSIPMANHLLRIKNAKDVIKQLEELNLFLSSSSESSVETHYRYHQLFSEFLQGSLEGAYPERLSDLHSKIADWYRQEGQLVKSITHYFLADEKQQAVSLVDQVSREMYLSGQAKVLDQWYSDIKDSPSLISNAPDLLLNLAKYKVTLSEFDQAMTLMDTAEEILIKREDHNTHCNLMVSRGMVLRFTGKYDEAARWAQAVQKKVDEYHLDRYYWYQAERLKGMTSYYLGDPDAALDSLKRAARALREMLDEDFQARQAHELVMTLADIGYIALDAGNIFEAQISYREALDIARRMRTNFNDLATGHNNFAYLNYLMGKYADAWAHYLQALEVAKYNNLNRLKAYINNGQADLLREIGEWKQAEDIYQNARQQAEKLEEYGAIADAYSGLVEVEINRQDFNTAMYYIRELARIQKQDIENPAYQLRFAKLYLAMGQNRLARKTFESLLANGNGSKPLSQENVELNFYYAILNLIEGTDDLARRHIHEALELAASLGYDQFLVNAVRNNMKLVGPVLKEDESPQVVSILERAKQSLPTLEELISDKREEEEEAVILNVFGLNHGQIRLNGRNLPHRAWSSVGARALFYFILDRKRVTKDEIALAFWPDFSQAKINSNFHATLWRVRKALGSKNIIVFEDGEYQFSPDAQIYFDVAEVQELLEGLDKSDSAVERRTAMRRILELYQSDYLEDIDMPWADDRRFELQNRFRQILGEMGEDYFEKRNLQTALEIYQRAIEYDPYQDDYHLRIMQCLAALGDKTAARKHYKKYKGILKEEMAIEPDDSLKKYYKSLD